MRMTDIFTPAKRSEVMARIRSTGNKNTELKLMALLRAARISGWHRHAMVRAGETIKVRPDFVFWRARVAVFVDGCFWHGCPRHGTQPRQNGEFWAAKICRNRARDRKVSRGLRQQGWAVLRIWECGLGTKQVSRSLARIRRALEKRAEKASL